ncbi:MAG: protein kinase [Myxococcota bacterium]
MANESIIGRLIAGKYKVTEHLGSGGFGGVYKARHVQTGGFFAVKVLWPHLAQENQVVERFELEARNTSRLHHPNTVRVVDYGWEADGTLFLVMEFIAGRPLTKLIKDEAPIGLDRALRIIRQVLKSLGEAHANDIIHRDIKPDNIMLVDQFGEPDFVKVVDFGISKVAGSAGPTATNATIGSPKYMAPERWLGQEADARTDLYAVGCVLFELLTGSPPWRIEAEGAAQGVAWMTAHMQRQPSTLGEASGTPFAEGLEGLVGSMLAKLAEDRPGSAEDVLARLDALGAPSGSRDRGWHLGTAATEPQRRPAGSPPTQGSRPPATSGAAHAATTDLGVAASTGLSGIEARPGRRHFGLAAGAAVAVLLAAGAVGLVLSGRGSDVPEATPEAKASEPIPAVATPAPEPPAVESLGATSPISKPAPPVTIHEDPPVPVPEVTLTITANVKGATVFDARGEALGSVPLEIGLEETRAKFPLQVRASGYRRSEVKLPVVDAELDPLISVELVALPTLEFTPRGAAPVSYQIGENSAVTIPDAGQRKWTVAQEVLDALDAGERVNLRARGNGYKQEVELGSAEIEAGQVRFERAHVATRRTSTVPERPGSDLPRNRCRSDGTCE